MGQPPALFVLGSRLGEVVCPILEAFLSPELFFYGAFKVRVTPTQSEEYLHDPSSTYTVRVTPSKAE